MRKIMKGGIAAAAAVALTASLGVSSAFAAGTTTLDSDNGAEWTVPTYAMTNTVWKDADGNVVAKDTAGATQYKVLTTWAEAWSTSGPDYLGVSNSAYFGNGGNGNAKVETLSAASTTTTVGVWATAANESPNAYNWNMFYNLYADSEAGVAANADKSDWTSASTTQNGGSDWSSEAGVWCGFKYRPEVVWTNNNLSASQAATYIEQIQKGQYSAAATKDGTYAPDVDDEGNYDSSFYIDGDEDYDPQIISPNNNSPYSFVASAYELADAAEKVISDTANYSGLESGESLDWKTVNKLPRSNRYSETPTECALNIEKLAKGSVYYALSKIADGTVQKKKVAYVCYPADYSVTDNRTGNTTTYTTEDQMIVAVYDYTENIGTGPMDGRASWTPLAVDQLSSDTVYQEKQLGSSVSTEDTASSTTSYTLYTVSADELASCDVIYCSPNVTYTENQFKGWIEEYATTKALQAKADDISYLVSWPCITNGSNYTMEKLIYGAYGMDFIYPELFPSMQLSCFWCDEIYHLTDESLASAMSWIYSTATMPEGTTLSDIPAQYTELGVRAKFAEGLSYYQANETSTGSKDTTINRVLNNTALDNTTEYSGSSYVFNGFAPTETWEKDTSDSSIYTYEEALADAIANAAALTSANIPDLGSAKSWAEDSIKVAYQLGLMTGYANGNFGVNDTLTRAQLAVIMWHIAEPDAYDNAQDTASGTVYTAVNETKFSDVSDSTYWTAAANWAVENGVINGKDRNGDGTPDEFDPFGTVTFEQFVTVLANYVDPDGAAATSTGSLSDFTDGSNVSSWAANSVAWAVDQGILSGYSNSNGTKSLKSKESVQRQRCAVLFDNVVSSELLDVQTLLENQGYAIS